MHLLSRPLAHSHTGMAQRFLLLFVALPSLLLLLLLLLLPLLLASNTQPLLLLEVLLLSLLLLCFRFSLPSAAALLPPLPTQLLQAISCRNRLTGIVFTARSNAFAVSQATAVTATVAVALTTLVSCALSYKFVFAICGGWIANSSPAAALTPPTELVLSSLQVCSATCCCNIT